MSRSLIKNFIHNHFGDAKECSKYIFKSNIKDNIKATRNIFNVSAQKMFINKLTKNDLKNIPKFSTIKSSIYREINRNLPKQINSFNELDLESPYIQTKNNKQFLIYKSEKIAIFQGELQSKLMYENYTDIFIDGTFFSAPKGVYQIIIIRVALEAHYKYFTTSFTLSSDKKEDIYKELFNIINNNIKDYQLKNKLKINFRPKNIHCDMEIALINAIQFIWPCSNVKICYFHWNQAMEKKYKDILENNISNKEAFKCLLTLQLIPEDVVESVFNELKLNNQCLELKDF